ncbi:MAG: hypothetical protein EKK41_22295 [Hyphomicrobiales bacterium]|nr:MAG: hypothetical protein EKK41_22295 [Hyphomicrobiales bacterium]
MATILPLAETQFNDALGVPLAGGSVYFYMPNTTTLKDTYQDANQTVANSNPVILDSAGRAIIFGSGAYRQVVYDALGNLIWDQTTSEATVGNASFGGTSTGSANAQIVSAGTFSGADGSTINFTAGFTNTGAMTVQVGPSGSPIAVLKNGPSGPVNLVAGDIAAGNIYSISYSVTLGTFQLLQSIPPVITIASEAQAEAGTDNTTVMTPLRTNQAIQVLGIPPLTSTGDMLYLSAPSPKARLGIGTAGQVLQVNSGATAPQWVDYGKSGTQATASGASVSFTGIPAGVRFLYVMANGVSFNSGDSLLLKLGTSGGLVSSGYTGGMGWFRGGGATASQSASTGMTIAQTSGGSDVCECLATLVLMNAATNTWIMQASGTFNGSAFNASTSSSVVSLPGALTQVQFSAFGGSSFDAGTLNIAWGR